MKDVNVDLNNNNETFIRLVHKVLKLWLFKLIKGTWSVEIAKE